jgi:hypothetical protein
MLILENDRSSKAMQYRMILGSTMNIGIELPEDVAEALAHKWGDLSRYAAEILAVDGYRSGVLTAEQLHCMLSDRTRLQVKAFLAEHGVPQEP